MGTTLSVSIGYWRDQTLLHENNWPVLEYDDNPLAKLNPSHFAGDGFDTDKMVITFFPEVITKLLSSGGLREACVIPGENPVPIYRFTEKEDILTGAAFAQQGIDALASCTVTELDRLRRNVLRERGCCGV